MSCPVCLASRTDYFGHGSDTLFETTSEEFTLRSCGDCRCLFLDPMPSPDEIAAYYPESYWWEASSGGLLRRMEEVYRRVVLADHVAFIRRAAREASPGRTARVLDVGCGPGTVLAMVRRDGLDVTGLDTSARAAEIAMREHGVRVLVGTIEKADLEAGGFDVVVLLHSLEHVPDPRSVLARARDLLTPTGRLIVQVPNIDSLQFRLFGARWYGLDIPRHLIDYSREGLLALLDACGFAPERTRHFNLRDNAPALASSLAPGLDPVSRAVRQRRRNGRETPIVSWARHAAYLLLVVASYPPALAEAALGRGATLMVQARVK